MHYLTHVLDVFLHIDVYLNTFLNTYGFWTYLLLFAVIFCETGLIVTPFFPGDSLLFATGSIVAQPGSGLNASMVFFMLLLASILGNQVNFFVGRLIGPRIFSAKNSLFCNKKQLAETQHFYEKHGGKTLVFARFLPIIRTFAPFVAGIGAMASSRFTLYNVLSAFLWIGSILGLGYFLGSLSFVQEYFTWFIYGIVMVSLLPVIWGSLHRREKQL